MVMWHLANAGHGPTIGMVPGVADGADGDTARVVLLDQLEAVGAAMLLLADQADRRGRVYRQGWSRRQAFAR